MPFCPDKKIVRTKKLSRQKNCPDKKIVRTKKLSGQKNYPDKKIVLTKKLSRQKIVRTKKVSGQKKCPDQKIVQTKKLSRPIFFVCVSNALGFFLLLSIWLLIFVLSNFCLYFCLIVQQRHGILFQKYFTIS